MIDRVTVDGAALVLSSLTFFVGASMAPEPSRVFSSDREEHLAIVAGHARRWRAMNFLMIAAVAETVGALWLIAPVGALPLLAAATYSVVAPLWVISLALRSTVSVDVARRLRAGGPMPGWYEAIESFGGLLFRVYLLSAYPAVIALGVALVRHRTAPGAGWSAIVIGVLAEANNVLGWPRVMGGPLLEPPFIVHVPLLVIGIGLLLHG
jgi:hypothetical protein